MLSVPPAVVLWDFGDTLVDERWMRRAPEECPAWPEAWVSVMRRFADDWDVGNVDEQVIVAALVDETGMSNDQVERHFAHCCRALRFNPVAWRVATEHQCPQAIVTVNPDLFCTRIVQTHGLETVFDVIVVSSQESTSDKTRLCEIALDRLAFTGDRAEALLIDNRADLVEAWRTAGGAGYWYRDDAQFAAAQADLFE